MKNVKSWISHKKDPGKAFSVVVLLLMVFALAWTMTGTPVLAQCDGNETDEFEPDNTPGNANPLGTISTILDENLPDDPNVQCHNFYEQGDVDWVFLEVSAGQALWIRAMKRPGSLANPAIELYDTDQTTLLASTISSDGDSFFPFKFKEAGTYYVKVTNKGVFGANTGYDLARGTPTPSRFVQGLVLDASSGNELSDVRITTTFSPSTVYQNLPTGEYLIALQPGLWTLTAQRAGYKNFVSDIDVEQEDLNEFDIVMERLASACNFTISPTRQTFTMEGGTGSISVSAPDGCEWTATSDVDWITIISGSSGNGSGTVNYGVTANSSPTSRSGTLSVAEQLFTVNQQGSAITPCEIGGADAGSLVTGVIDTQCNSLTLLLSQRPPTDINGHLYISLEAPGIPSLAVYLFFRPIDSMVPLPNGSYVQVVQESGIFLPGAEDFYYFEGFLSNTAEDLSFEVGTAGLSGLTLVFTTWYLPEGLPLNNVNLQRIQRVEVMFQ